MKRPPIFPSILILFLLLELVGCSSTSVTKADKPLPLRQQTDLKVKNTAPAAPPPVHVNFSDNDKLFIKGIKDSVEHSQQVISQLKTVISESQQTDELGAAQENMNSAKREILFIWNQIHNQYQPDTASLKKIKITYENILMEYRKGLNLQIQGIDTTGGTRVMEGLQIANKAQEDLDKLSTAITKLG
jgi:hypothetical protein